MPYQPDRNKLTRTAAAVERVLQLIQQGNVQDAQDLVAEVQEGVRQMARDIEELERDRDKYKRLAKATE